MNRRALRFGAIIGAATVSTLAIAPVFAAAAPVSQSTSNAITLAIAGNPISSGTVKATHDGESATKTGETKPLLGVLGNQSLLNVGALTQEANATVDSDGNGNSTACGGVAGQGSGVVNVGDSSCIDPSGKAVGLSIANLDLSGVTLIDPASTLGALSALNGVAAQLLGPLTSALTGALAPLSNLGINGGASAIYSFCQASPGAAQGGAKLASADLSVSLPGFPDPISLLQLEPNPGPNTHVITDLDKVLDKVIDSVELELTTVLNGALGPIVNPIVALFPTIKTQLIDGLVAQVANALAPLESNVLDITLNKQVKTKDTIDVTALDLQLLPAAAQFTGSSLVSAQIGHVSCGPNGKVTKNTATPTPTPSETAGNPEVPTIVDSGLSGSANHTARDVLTATAALMLLAGTAGLIGYRRMLTK